MDATLSLLNLAGAIALLLWGVHMVQSGVQRAFSDLRRFLAKTLDNRIKAAAAGLGVTTILQSSTASSADGPDRRDKIEGLGLTGAVFRLPNVTNVLIWNRRGEETKQRFSD